MQQLWGSRFSKSPEKIVSDFNSSLSFDSKLYQYDIEGSIAHAKMLGLQGILSNEEAEQIISALNEILNETPFPLRPHFYKLTFPRVRS